jgi:hypothetical protein
MTQVAISGQVLRQNPKPSNVDAWSGAHFYLRIPRTRPLLMMKTMIAAAAFGLVVIPFLTITQSIPQVLNALPVSVSAYFGLRFCVCCKSPGPAWRGGAMI